MAKTKKIAISIPPRELSGGHVPASVFESHYLDAFNISASLQAAIEIVKAHYPEHAPIYLARPEIFTHGVILNELMKKTGPVREHVSMSDGISAKLIPGLTNHLYVYGLHRREGLTGFRKLASYVPEMFKQYATQINTFQRFDVNGASFMPAPHIILPQSPQDSLTATFYRFYMNGHPLDANAASLLAGGPTEVPSLDRYATVTYIPFTESAAYDRGFCKMVAESIERAYFDPTSCILLGLPHLDADVSLNQRVISLLAGIGDSRIRFPHVFCNNVLVLTENLSETFFSADGIKPGLVLHETFAFWTYTRDFYSASSRILFCLAQEDQDIDADLGNLLSETFGMAPEIRKAVKLPLHES